MINHSGRIPKNRVQRPIFRHSLISLAWFPDWVVARNNQKEFLEMTSVTSGTAMGKTQRLADNTPISHLDPYSDQALIDPWPTYAELQDAGPAVWLSKY
jgi:hypothetical protein